MVRGPPPLARYVYFKIQQISQKYHLIFFLASNFKHVNSSKSKKKNLIFKQHFRYSNRTECQKIKQETAWHLAFSKQFFLLYIKRYLIKLRLNFIDPNSLNTIFFFFKFRRICITNKIPSLFSRTKYFHQKKKKNPSGIKRIEFETQN